MTWEIVVVYALLLAGVISFIRERVSADLTAMGLFGALLLLAVVAPESTLPTPEALLGIFANPAPLTIGAMFILSAALEKTGVITILATAVKCWAHWPYPVLMVLLVAVVGGISAFMNNTPVVVIFLPVILSLAREAKISASKLLIPLSFASLFGGLCTLVGTSTNILASGLLLQFEQPPLRMFELGALGLPMMAIGALYLALFGRRLLPERATLTALLNEDERREYFTEAYIPVDSSLIGKTVQETSLLRSKALRVLEIVRHEVALPADPRTVTLEAGDRLVLAARPSGVAEVRNLTGLDLGTEPGLQTISAHEGSIVEGIIGPRSGIAGYTIRELNFRQRFRMVILAIHRRGINLRDQIDSVPLEHGDIVLMMGTEEARESLRRGNDILLLDQGGAVVDDRRRKAPIVVATLLGVVAVASLGWAPIAVTALLGVLIVLFTGCLRAKEAYASIDWGVLMLIFGMLGFGLAMDTTGAGAAIAGKLVFLVEAYAPEDWKPLLLLACVYILSNVLTAILSNNATVVLLLPIAMGLGQAMGLDPRPFVIAVTIAASADFSTPIGYQTNTYVYGVGNYRFSDFLRVGIPLNILYFLGTLVIVPLVWPW